MTTNAGRRRRPFGAPPSSLLRAKLRAPALPVHHIRRPRLDALLDEVVRAPLSLVVAPAGTGKTSLVSGWTAESATTSAWFSLDESDRDGAQLWSGLIAVLETLKPGCGERALAALRRPGPLTAVVNQLLDDLDASPGAPVVLVIDDVHLLDDHDGVGASFALFVEHLPSWLHVLLVTRRVPNLPLDRLRARAQLGEVGFAELRFSRDEAIQLLSRLTPSLSDQAIEAATERAAGWATGLQMAALAARSAHAQQGFEALMTGDGLLVDDYIWHEVLAAEPPELVTALAEIAVVERVNASLAEALTGRSDAGDLLHQAEARGLFVIRLGPEGWFEVHPVARAALVAGLARRSSNRVPELHARAARWFERAGEVAFALDHWLRAARPADALRLLAAHHADLYDTGREATIVRTIASIPVGVATADLASMLGYAWCHLLVDRRRYLEIVEQATWWADRAEQDDTVRAQLTMLQAIAATMSGRSVEGGALARLAMAHLGEAGRRDPRGRFGWTMVARELALSERWDDTGDEVREAEHGLSRDPEGLLAFEGNRALGAALAGRPVDALRVAAGVQPAAAAANMSVLRTELAIAQAVAHRELGDRPRALAELQVLADAPAETMLYCKILAHFELAQAQLDEGDLDAAGHTFEQAETLIETESFGCDGRGWLGRVGNLLALAAGNIDEARRRAEQVDDPFWRAIAAGRVELAEGNRAEALAGMETAAPRCVRHEVVLELLRSRAVENHDHAVKRATSAVELAVANGMLQTVASEGGEVLELIECAAWRVPESWMDRLRRAAVPGPGAPPVGHRVATDVLTERERDIIRFLPSRLTLREIASELYISVNTLKFHLKVIYRKLGVNSRSEATEVARMMTPARTRPADQATARAPSPSDARTPPGSAAPGGTSRRAP